MIGHHGEAEGHRWRSNTDEGPDAPCFHVHKDISIPTSNFVRRPPPPRPGHRDLLAFYAGSGTFFLPKQRKVKNQLPFPGIREGRRRIKEVWGNRTRNPDIVVSSLTSPQEYWAALGRAKFCPIMGGFAPWTPRLTEIVFAGCVPVVFSSLLPPFVRVLDWSQFSVRVPSLHGIWRLREILEAQDHAALAANLAPASHALWYDLAGERAQMGSSQTAGGEGMLPFLLLEMHLVLQEAAKKPLVERVSEVFGPVPSTPLAPKKTKHLTKNETFYYEGQVWPCPASPKRPSPPLMHACTCRSRCVRAEAASNVHGIACTCRTTARRGTLTTRRKPSRRAMRRRPSSPSATTACAVRARTRTARCARRSRPRSATLGLRRAQGHARPSGAASRAAPRPRDPARSAWAATSSTTAP